MNNSAAPRGLLFTKVNKKHTCCGSEVQPIWNPNSLLPPGFSQGVMGQVWQGWCNLSLSLFLLHMACSPSHLTNLPSAFLPLFPVNNCYVSLPLNELHYIWLTCLTSPLSHAMICTAVIFHHQSNGAVSKSEIALSTKITYLLWLYCHFYEWPWIFCKNLLPLVYIMLSFEVEAENVVGFFRLFVYNYRPIFCNRTRNYVLAPFLSETFKMLWNGYVKILMKESRKS